jgi:hypothetical protein
MHFFEQEPFLLVRFSKHISYCDKNATFLVVWSANVSLVLRHSKYRSSLRSSMNQPTKPFSEIGQSHIPAWLRTVLVTFFCPIRLGIMWIIGRPTLCVTRTFRVETHFDPRFGFLIITKKCVLTTRHATDKVFHGPRQPDNRTYRPSVCIRNILTRRFLLSIVSSRVY